MRFLRFLLSKDDWLSKEAIKFSILSFKRFIRMKSSHYTLFHVWQCRVDKPFARIKNALLCSMICISFLLRLCNKALSLLVQCSLKNPHFRFTIGIPSTTIDSFIVGTFAIDEYFSFLRIKRKMISLSCIWKYSRLYTSEWNGLDNNIQFRTSMAMDE